MPKLASLPPLAVLAAALAAAAPARADVVSEWNARAADLATAARLPTPMTMRAMAIAQVAVYQAVLAIEKDGGDLRHHPGAEEAAVAAATRTALVRLIPSQVPAVEAAYQEALRSLPDSPARGAGIAAGEQAAAEVLAFREADGWSAPEEYRPRTAPGVYVPTVIPVLPRWGQRRPWLLASGDQLRPPPPPALASATWARDLEEIRALGGRSSARRTAEQTAVARFWEATGAALYFPLARALTDQPGRSLLENARLLATLAMAMDDAFIAVFDAKYAYGFWRPMVAIRNADQDGNDATQREPGWLPFIETPMHPEYPCAHCIIASTVATVLRETAGGKLPARFSTSSPTASGQVRSWSRLEDMVDEVATARICGGMHYRNSTEVGIAMGRKVGEIAAAAQRRWVEAR